MRKARGEQRISGVLPTSLNLRDSHNGRNINGCRDGLYPSDSYNDGLPSSLAASPIDHINVETLRFLTVRV